MISSWRSLMFVPADAEARIDKAAGSPADAVILDLEDGVSPASKPAARRATNSAVGLLRAAGKGVVIRINSGWRDAAADLEAVITPGITAIMVPKVETPGRLEALAGMISEWEVEREAAAIGIIALIESAAGLGTLDTIARAPRVAALALGPEDFAAGMGVMPSPELLDLPCRRIALAAAAAGIAAFATPVSIAAFRDDAATRTAACASRAYGVAGALCIHPRQVAIANEVFRPSPDELVQAVAIFDAWTAAGSGGVIVLDGRMIDAPVAAQALRVLRRADDLERNS